MELSEVVRDACKVLFGVSVHAGWAYWRERRRERVVESLADRPLLSWDEALRNDDLGFFLAFGGGVGLAITAVAAVVVFWPLWSSRVPHPVLTALAVGSPIAFGAGIRRLQHVRRTGRAAK